MQISRCSHKKVSRNCCLNYDWSASMSDEVFCLMSAFHKHLLLCAFTLGCANELNYFQTQKFLFQFASSLN